MVLVLKHWKSRSSPGIKAGGQGRAPSKYHFDGARINPFTISKSRCRCKPRGGFFVSGLGASEEGAIEVRSTSQGRPAARTPDLIRGREAKPTDVGTGA